MSGSVVGILDLPREVRDECYSYLRKCPPATDEKLAAGFAVKFPLSVLLLNRKVFEEARQALYQSNPFTVLIKE